MVDSFDELCALRARLEYVERREKEREQDLHEQLSGVRRELLQIRSDLGRAAGECCEEMTRLQESWQTVTEAMGAALERAERNWRELMLEERERLAKEHQQREQERFDSLDHVVNGLAEQLTRLLEMVASANSADTQTPSKVEHELQQHRLWLQRHIEEEAEFLKLFEETCTQLQDAVSRERQAREESMSRIERLLTRRSGHGTATNVS